MNALADVAQLVEHHLAKVRVAGSNPVVRSRKSPGRETYGGTRKGPSCHVRVAPCHSGAVPRLQRSGHLKPSRGDWVLAGRHQCPLISSSSAQLLCVGCDVERARRNASLVPRLRHTIDAKGDILNSMATTEPSGNNQRTTLVIDRNELRRAQQVLGTKTTRETVNMALHEVSRVATLRQAAALVRRGGVRIVEPEDLPELRRTRSI